VENDAQEVVQEEEDLKMEGYFEKNDVVEKDEIQQCWAWYFEKLEYPHPLFSTTKQSMRNEFLELYLFGVIGWNFVYHLSVFQSPPLHLDS
jgi:hypothetical protein